jgi:hypothetical protein
MQVTSTNFSGGTNPYTNPTVTGTANYLYWLCGKFALDGQYIISGPGGGSVISSGSIIQGNVNPVEFEVDATSIIPSGDSSITLISFIGYNLLFVRSNVTQSTVDNGGSYFTWDKNTGVFTCFPSANTGELFQLYPFI